MGFGPFFESTGTPCLPQTLAGHKQEAALGGFCLECVKYLDREACVKKGEFRVWSAMSFEVTQASQGSFGVEWMPAENSQGGRFRHGVSWCLREDVREII